MRIRWGAPINNLLPLLLFLLPMNIHEIKRARRVRIIREPPRKKALGGHVVGARTIRA